MSTENGTTTQAITPTPIQAAIERAQGDGTIAAFSSQGAFESAQRMAKALASSTLVPEAYRGNIPNVLIAMELASRIGVSVFATMQNLDIIHGRPSWRAQFLIATVNGSGRFTALRFRWVGKEGTDSWGCRAVANDKTSGEECLGSMITIGLAKAEGWYDRKGSKWRTMAEQMMMYRAAAFWTRIYAPELSLGMGTAEEAIDTYGETVANVATPVGLVPGSSQALEAALLGQPAPVVAETFDSETGEVPMPEERMAGED
jgi:hypothetical protein